MVKYDLNRLQTNTARMQQAMPRGPSLPEWAKSKLTQARSHIANVANYQQSKLGYTFGATSTQTAALATLAVGILGTVALNKGSKNKKLGKILQQGGALTGVVVASVGGSVFSSGLNDASVPKGVLGAILIAVGGNFVMKSAGKW
jgi:hypothetical protein